VDIKAILNRIGERITEKSEKSQAVSRVVILVIFTVYFTLYNSPLQTISIIFLVSSVGWLAWIKIYPEFEFRKIGAIVLDKFIVGSALWISGSIQISIFLLYFWVTIGNGYRFGSKYTLYATGLTLLSFWSVLLFSPGWAGQMAYGIELTIGQIMISLFAYRILHNLEVSIEEGIRLELQAEVSETKAMRDSLTGLCNRDFANKWLESKAKSKSKVGVLFLDLDNFKKFNDNYGHHIGDEVLINISRRLQNSVRSRDYVCRYAGDEFIILIDDEDRSTIDEIGERIRLSLDSPMRVEGEDNLIVTGSIGIAVLGVHGKNQAEVLRSADSAMYMAKRAGRNQVAWYKDTISNEIN